MAPSSSTATGGAQLLVSVDGEPPIAWAQFCAANAEAFEAGELEAIRRDLERDGSYQAGGGAAADVLITVAVPPLTALEVA